MVSKNCLTCHHYLGGGACDISAEKECAESEFELWEPYIYGGPIPIVHVDYGATTRKEALCNLGILEVGK